MHQKKHDLSGNRRIYARLQCNDCRHIVALNGQTHKKICKCVTVYGCLFIILFIFMQCTPPPPPTLINACPEPLWKKYAALQSYQVKAETARLEALLAAGDTAVSDSGDISDSAEGKKLSTFEIRQRLYELSIHHANPDYDFNKIFDYVSFLYQHGGPDSLHYLNWGRVVRDHNTLLAERDSLKTVVTAISEGEKKGSISVENQKKEIRGCLKQIDSLNSVIKTQQEMIVKLQNIDVMMEKQRGRGQ